MSLVFGVRNKRYKLHLPILSRVHVDTTSYTDSYLLSNFWRKKIGILIFSQKTGQSYLNFTCHCLRMAELLNGVELLTQDGKLVKAEEHLKGKLVGLYFSAGWCGPCRMFTPKLKRFYEKIVGEENKDFEVIFVSRDREEEDLLEYFNEKHGEWVTIPFGSEKIQELLDKYEVKTIPAFRVIKSDGTILVNDARTEVQEKGQEDAEGLYEEWEAFNM